MNNTTTTPNAGNFDLLIDHLRRQYRYIRHSQHPADELFKVQILNAIELLKTYSG